MTTDCLQETVKRFQAVSQSDARIVAAFVGGSLATGTADEYSDLDLYLIVADEQYESFFLERATFMCQLGEPVFLEDFNGFGFDMILFILENGAKGELGLAKASRFLHIHNGAYRALVDKTGLLKGITFPIERISPEEQRHNLENLIKSFWRYLYLVTGALGRSHLLSASSYLEGMRHRLVQVCRLSVDFADSGGHPRLEALLTPPLVERLSWTFPHLEREAMIASVKKSAQLFQQLAKPLAQAHNIIYPTSLEQVVLMRFEMMTQAVVKENSHAA